MQRHEREEGQDYHSCVVVLSGLCEDKSESEKEMSLQDPINAP